MDIDDDEETTNLDSSTVCFTEDDTEADEEMATIIDCFSIPLGYSSF